MDRVPYSKQPRQYRSVAALLAAEARPGDTAFAFSSPTLSVKLSLPPAGSITAASLAEVEGGSLQHARMIMSILAHPLHPCAPACTARLAYLIYPPAHRSISPLDNLRSPELVAVILAGLAALPPTPTPTTARLAADYTCGLYALHCSAIQNAPPPTFHDTPFVKYVRSHPAAVQKLVQHAIISPHSAVAVIPLPEVTMLQEIVAGLAQSDADPVVQRQVQHFVCSLLQVLPCLPEHGQLQHTLMTREELEALMRSRWLTSRMLAAKVATSLYDIDEDQPPFMRGVMKQCATAELLGWLLESTVVASCELPWYFLVMICNYAATECKVLLVPGGGRDAEAGHLAGQLHRALAHAAGLLQTAASKTQVAPATLRVVNRATRVMAHFAAPVDGARDLLWRLPLNAAAPLVPSVLDSCFVLLDKLLSRPSGSSSSSGRSTGGSSVGSGLWTNSRDELESLKHQLMLAAGLLKGTICFASVHAAALQPHRVVAWLEAAVKAPAMQESMLVIQLVPDLLRCHRPVQEWTHAPPEAPCLVPAAQWQNGAVQLRRELAAVFAAGGSPLAGRIATTRPATQELTALLRDILLRCIPALPSCPLLPGIVISEARRPVPLISSNSLPLRAACAVAGWCAEGWLLADSARMPDAAHILTAALRHYRE